MSSCNSIESPLQCSGYARLSIVYTARTDPA